MANILLVDDDVLTQQIIATMLRKGSHQIKCAAHGQEAISLLSKEKPDLMITDIVMPKKSGITLIAEALERYPHLPIIAISAGGRIDKERYLDLSERVGATVTLQKPIQCEQLLETIQTLIAKKTEHTV